MKHSVQLILLCVVVLGLSGCASTQMQEENPYADPSQWISLPPTALKPVDVFYLYPTVYARTSDTASIYSERDDATLRGQATMAFQLQATAFAQVANLYAPMYRQVDAATVLSLPFDQRDSLLQQAPLEDAIAAFDYYIQHYNHDRPFILAGHSQGSDVLKLLLAGYMQEHPEVYARMVAAYCIGASITPAFLAEYSHLKFAQKSDDTQVIISYNTEGPGVTEPNLIVSKDALVINPLSWSRTEEPVDAQNNLGSLLPGPNGNPALLAGIADARLDLSRSVVICSTVEGKLPVLASSAHFPKGVYHSFDYALYYANIAENAMQRFTAYQNQ